MPKIQGPLKTMAMIQNGTIINVAVWDGVTPWNPQNDIPGLTLVDITVNSNGVGIGYTTPDGGQTFVAPPGVIGVNAGVQQV
jgi:hypothetical protein